jgi:hypothetical protein
VCSLFYLYRKSIYKYSIALYILNKTEKSFSNLAASQFCFSRSNNITILFFARLQGCVIVALQGCVIVALQGCMIVALRGCMIVVLQDCVIVALQGCMIVVSRRKVA